MTVYGYARVSTKAQSLDAQINDLVKAGVDRKNIFAEKYTGKTTDRPQFKRCLSVLKPGDTLTVTKLDRFARSTSEALEVMDTLRQKHIKLNVLTMGVIDDTPTGKLVFTVFSAFADFERSLILARTAEGKAWNRAHVKGYTEGRPRTSDAKFDWAFSLRESGMTWKRVAKTTGIGVATLYNEQRRRRAMAEAKKLESEEEKS